ncbi:MAG: TlpA disulfide reductase family protein [bacterium]|nr:TlpA disulfide reductase family protein [bacterium]
MKKHKFTIIGLLLALPIFFIVYSFYPGQANTQLKIPTIAPTILSTNLYGDSFDISKYKGKVVVLNFWASWSKASRAENKNLVRIYQKYKNNNKVAFVSVSLDTDELSWKSAIEEDECLWKAHFCDFKKYDSPIAKAYKINTIPVFYLIDKSNTVVQTTPKVIDIETAIDGLLK